MTYKISVKTNGSGWRDVGRVDAADGEQTIREAERLHPEYAAEMTRWKAREMEGEGER